MEAAHEISRYFLPHSHCVANDPVTIALHVLGDVGTALAYFLIPVGIVMHSWKYRLPDMEGLRALLLHGAAFILLCGTTHVMTVWNWWNADYTASGAVALATAIISLTFVWRFWNFLKSHPLS